MSIRTIYQLGLRFAKQEAPVDVACLMENASLDNPVPSAGSGKQHIYPHCHVRLLADDAFSRVCDRLQDPSRHVRQLAASLIGDLAEVCHVF